MSKEFWEKYEKMSPEEKQAAHRTQWASSMYENAKEQRERCEKRKS